MSDSRNDGLPILLAFVAGSVIGIGMGLLLAPRPGKDTRHQLAEFARRAKSRAGEVAAALRHDRSSESVHAEG